MIVEGRRRYWLFRNMILYLNWGLEIYKPKQNILAQVILKIQKINPLFMDYIFIHLEKLCFNQFESYEEASFANNRDISLKK